MTAMPPPMDAGAGTTSLRRNTAWALAGNIGYAACQFGILSAIAKLTTAADVGRFALALALTAPVIGFANLNLRGVQAVDARAEYVFGAYLGLRLVTTALALVVVWGISVGLGYQGVSLYVILVVGLAKAFESLSDVIFGRLQKAENLRRVGTSMLVKGVLSLVTVGVLLQLTGDLLVAAIGLCACWAAVFLVYDFPAVVRLESARPTFDRPTLSRLAWLALPVGLLTALTSLTINIPRYDIEASLGAAQLGHFAAIAYFALALSQPILALGIAVSPRLAHYFVTDRRAYRSLSQRTLAIAGVLGILVVMAATFFGRVFLRLAYTPEYAAHHDLLVWIALGTAVVFVNSALGYAVTAARRFREQTWIAALALTVCAVTSHFAVPRFGLIGAAWAVLASEITRALCLGTLYRELSCDDSQLAAATLPIGALRGESVGA
jgi:O-antigen/teichoic acid export membrane protein